MHSTPRAAHGLFAGPPPAPVLWFLRQISDSASGGNALDLTYAAGALTPLLDYPRRELLQRLTEALSSPQSLAVLEEQMRLQQRGVFTPYTLRLPSAKGLPVDIQVCPRTILLPDGTEAITATLAPAPAGLEEQRTMQAERARLLSLLDRLPAYVALIAPDHSIRYANQTFRELFGPPGNRPCYAAIREESTPCADCPPFDAFDTGSLSICEWTSPASGRSFRIYTYPFTDVDRTPLVLKLGMDITQSKQVQEALALSEERYRSITDNLAVGIAVIDANMRITAANPLFSRWFSPAPSSLKGGTQDDAARREAETLETLLRIVPKECASVPADNISPSGNIPPSGSTTPSGTTTPSGSITPFGTAEGTPENGNTPADLILRTFADGQVHEQEFSCRLHTAHCAGSVTSHNTTNNADHAFRITACPIRGTAGDVPSVIVLLEDITERKRVAERLNRVRQLEAMGTLAAGIAHEINQPLSALRLYASGLEMLMEQQRTIAPETLLSRLGWILREADNIHEIIAHMRSLVMQQDAPPTGSACLNKAVERALSLVGAQLTAHGIRVDLCLTPFLPEALANPVQLEQVVINLVVNAMHALDTVEASGQDKWIRITTGQTQDDALRLEVRDNGPGLQGLESRVFDPFFTTKEAGGGMGLGLSIVHTFVEAWLGEIAIVPPPEGTGAVFVVRLHAAGHAAQIPAPGATPNVP
ncbi:PAS domain-containing sensor histidine kinase [Desulfovibrio psychrotolerans]|uniref:histidine kinase n=1 Tax=Desulfovibrio psychrotolerans TaxID=415242 RepID=A0A7J0BVX3_9BACT|nr:PAS domain-containing sensor histidine kinase [Desulfovibrio psychrotolerans]GFM37833.1 histidine kinase [Desulfovibrio psychrotolerans]